MSVLVDSSVWIDYFRSGKHSTGVDTLVDENMLATNDLILAELIPSLRLQKQRGLIRLLETIRNVPIRIDWPEIMDMQVKCLRQGINKIGIPDLIIAQQVIKQKLTLYTLDKHFRLMTKIFPLTLF